MIVLLFHFVRWCGNKKTMTKFKKKKENVSGLFISETTVELTAQVLSAQNMSGSNKENLLNIAWLWMGDD